MTRITYTDAEGHSREIDAADGASVMQTAVSRGVPGIVGECGGSLMCSTCHVYVDEAFTALLPAPDDDEDEMLDAVAAERRSNSRLSCQVRVSDAIDGLCVQTPERQY
ncbi:2Fe-2S iron-sulfur cluster-binding protein [Microbacterium rhizophilus]|uniref:2Fe-2S iron-sulfur cluster-binding protein n=1 Tax=Microbacterium rhizophilus TaxID=3138934 RepID=UPI0031EA6721